MAKVTGIDGKSFIKGQRFGKLVAVRPLGWSSDRSWCWLCKCDCGNETILSANRLRSGEVQACGYAVTIKSDTNEEHCNGQI
jgi:hypothetical protein